MKNKLTKSGAGKQIPHPAPGAIVVPLSAPIRVQGLPVASLTMRPPTTPDVVDIGFPYLAIMSGNDWRIEFRAREVMRFIARLSGVPLNCLSQLALADLQVCQATVQSFFGREQIACADHHSGVHHG